MGACRKSDRLCTRKQENKPLQARLITVSALAATSFARLSPAARAHADRPTPLPWPSLLLPLLPMKLMEDLTFANPDEVDGELDLRDIL